MLKEYRTELNKVKDGLGKSEANAICSINAAGNVNKKEVEDLMVSAQNRLDQLSASNKIGKESMISINKLIKDMKSI